MALLHLIEQVSVVGMGDATAQVVDVLIDGDRFVGLAPRIDLSTVNLDECTDGRGKLLIPGLINAHHHSHDRFDKGRFFPVFHWKSGWAYTTRRLIDVVGRPARCTCAHC
nr:hypothetical protein GCM10020185_87800 [Pseudomonas brassicacearum subsp. brassicacearum]